MLSYIVKIVDAFKRDAGPPVYRLVEYHAQALTAASARIQALEHHMARVDRPGRAVRCVIVEPAGSTIVPVVQISDAPIAIGELEQLERIHQPYVIA